MSETREELIARAKRMLDIAEGGGRGLSSLSAKVWAQDVLKAARLQLDDAVVEKMCRAHDEEECAQKGEPNPWRQDLVDQYIAENGAAAHAEWAAERVAAMRCALKVVGLA